MKDETFPILHDPTRLLVDPVEVTPATPDLLYRLADDFPAGCTVHLSEGVHVVDRTIRLPSNVTILGRGRDLTTLVLAPGSNCHLFTNADHDRGNTSISLAGFSIEGNGDRQERPADHKALTFCCAMYFKRCRSVQVSEIDFFDIRQTAVHFNSSEGLRVTDCIMRKLGWSGVSTSDGSNIEIDVVVMDAGRDHMHSGIHFDGGIGVYCRAAVSDVTGNGVMLDSAFAPLSHVVVDATATRCKRGLSLSGSAVHALSNVSVTGEFFENREVGIMVSNARSVWIADSRLVGNGQAGLLLQGRNGACEVLVVDCHFSGNPEDILEIHASRDNWIFEFGAEMDRISSVNARSYKSFSSRKKGASRAVSGASG